MEMLWTASLDLWLRGAYQAQSLTLLWLSGLAAAHRWAWQGPSRPGWSWPFEVARQYARLRTETALALPPAKGRAYLESMSLPGTSLARTRVERVSSPVPGEWVVPDRRAGNRTMLYLHGGGYAFYTTAQRDFIARLALAARARTFALDYPLAPEHPFPAQLNAACAAYAWLRGQGIAASDIILAGDSAGGNLALALLLATRDAGGPLPALTVCLSPWVDVTNAGASVRENAPADWITRPMADQWATWFCGAADPHDARVSPLYADLGGLSPIYIQAGGAEILRDTIREFTDRARAKGVDVTLEEWPDMVHVFQSFGEVAPAAIDAVRRLADVIDDRLPAR